MQESPKILYTSFKKLLFKLKMLPKSFHFSSSSYSCHLVKSWEVFEVWCCICSNKFTIPRTDHEDMQYVQFWDHSCFRCTNCFVGFEMHCGACVCMSMELLASVVPASEKNTADSGVWCSSWGRLNLKLMW